MCVDSCGDEDLRRGRHENEERYWKERIRGQMEEKMDSHGEAGSEEAGTRDKKRHSSKRRQWAWPESKVRENVAV